MALLVGPRDKPFQLVLVDMKAFGETWGDNLQDPTFVSIYNYARLLQRIFYLQDPNKSRRREVLLPNTHAELMEICGRDATQCQTMLEKVTNVMGAGFTGFSGG